MDPLTIIVTAVVTGAASALKPTAGQAVKDAYAGLKRMILDKYGDAGDVTSAVESVETRPESEGRKATLGEELADAGADKDQEVLKAAQEVLKKADPKGSQAGQYTHIVGDHNVVTNVQQQAGDNAIQIGQVGGAGGVKIERVE